MEILREPPSGFQGIVKCYAMARHLPYTNKLDLKVGLSRGGALFATGRLDGYRQVAMFSEHLRDLGWHEHLLGSDIDMQGCDLLFSHPDDHGDSRIEDPSFIRRAPVQLWGEQLPTAA